MTTYEKECVEIILGLGIECDEYEALEVWEEFQTALFTNEEEKEDTLVA